MSSSPLSLMAGNLAVLMGGDNGFRGKPNKYNKNGHNIYQVAIKKRKVNPSYFNLKTGRNGNIKNIIKGEKEVVCFEVNNGLLVTMNNGKPAVQGNCKQLHHIIRLYEFLQRYIKGTPYKECLISEDREYLINVKRNCHNLEEARTIAKQLTEIAVETKKVYMDLVPLKVNKEVEVLLNNVLINIMKEHLKTEILKED